MDELKGRGYTVVGKPWGGFKQFILNNKCTVKILEVIPGGVLSLQSHETRDELWVALDDGLIVELNDKIFELKKGEEVFISKGSKHRLSSKVGGRMLEISLGLFDEEDIKRYDDEYGRA